MGVHVIRMPDIGEGIAEVELVAWHVSPGDAVAEDQVLADVMRWFSSWVDGGFFASSGNSTTSSWGSGDNVGEEFLDVGGVQCLGEEHWPVGFNGVSGCFDNLGKFLSL